MIVSFKIVVESGSIVLIFVFTLIDTEYAYTYRIHGLQQKEEQKEN